MRTNKRLNRHKFYVFVLLILVLVIGSYQVNKHLEKVQAQEEKAYTAMIFTSPMQQSIEVIQISKSTNQESVIDNTSSKIEFSDIKNYKEENLQRYEAYQKLNEDLLCADVIWRVNTNLDKEFYSDVAEVADYTSITAVVNKYNYLPSYYTPADLVLMDSEDIELYLREDAYLAYLEMKEVLKDQDINIRATDAYRSFNGQKTLYEDTIKKIQAKDSEADAVAEADLLVARPGFSEHESGLAIDITDKNKVYDDFDKSDAYLWIKDNAHRYGFIIRYRADAKLTGHNEKPWHLRYVGQEVAVDMYENNIHILEEYLDKKILED